MPSTDDSRRQAASRPILKGSIIEEALSDLDSLVDTIAAEGNLGNLIALVCQRGQTSELSSAAEPDHAPHPGVRAAIEAYAGWERTKGGSMDTEVRVNPGDIESPADEPEILPLSLLGKWVAWSSDGMRIIASAETSEQAESLAIEAGESEPILHRPMALH